MNSPQPLIRMKGVHKSFVTNGNRVDVLRDVSLEIQQEEMVAIVGASGVGKSTLLHVLGTLERPDRGDILYGGKDVFSYDDERLASFRNETIGFVFQFHHLLPEFNAMENAMMPALIKEKYPKDFSLGLIAGIAQHTFINLRLRIFEFFCRIDMAATTPPMRVMTAPTTASTQLTISGAM